MIRELKYAAPKYSAWSVPVFFKKWKKKNVVNQLYSARNTISIAVTLDCYISEQTITRDEAVQYWTYILRHGIAEIFNASAISTPLKAEACSALATVGSQIFECLPVRRS